MWGSRTVVLLPAAHFQVLAPLVQTAAQEHAGKPPPNSVQSLQRSLKAFINQLSCLQIPPADGLRLTSARLGGHFFDRVGWYGWSSRYVGALPSGYGCDQNPMDHFIAQQLSTHERAERVIEHRPLGVFT
ncbi:hypothetical protein CC78DRAFT_576375 [Lojkania enalia]|uniref:Uncharacterized protein n=1 Tax=Lojkania enalia TaxID=147567 RepID=A0A9P4N3E7_9PLEO|nr:hypothetical protein CC78DRAFT_576375 [Didymosphaeria enalia]